MPNLIDLTGRRFSRLVVLSRAHDYRRGYPQWLCRCDCGAETVVRGQGLTKGTTMSCGCLNREQKRQICRDRNGTHGMSGTPTYTTWVNMRERCTNPNASGFDKYGARGVTVCERWNSFENFLADMGPRPPRLSIDRIDNAKGYEPGNCRWATMKTQQNNRTNNARLSFNGTTLTVAQWAARVGVHPRTVRNRIKAGWPIEKVLAP